MSQTQIIQRRGQLLAELYLTDLKPQFFVTSNTGYDFFLGFKTKSGAIVTVPVEVKATDQPIGDHYRLYATPEQLSALTKSNLPVLLFIVDAKRNEFFFTWGSKIAFAHRPSIQGAAHIKVPVTKLTDSTKADLLAEIEAMGSAVAERTKKK
jgi:hypothetical protein